MPKHKSPFTEEIAREWERLIHDGENQVGDSEKRFRWSKLYTTYFVDGRWTVSPWDAALISLLGSTLALQDGSYQLAKDLCRQFLDHEGLTNDHSTEVVNFYVRHGMADILLGNVEDGLEWLSRPFQETMFEHRLYPFIVRAELKSLFHDLGQENLPNPLVANFLVELIRYLPKGKSLVDRASKVTSYRELDEIFDDTYPKRSQ